MGKEILQKYTIFEVKRQLAEMEKQYGKERVAEMLGEGRAAEIDREFKKAVAERVEPYWKDIQAYERGGFWARLRVQIKYTFRERRAECDVPKYVLQAIEEVCTRKKDIREAISCYNSRQYNACALILFSIIDSRLIRLQRKNTEKYSVGAGAVAKYKEIVEQQTSDRGKLFLSLSYANLFPCLFTVFEDPNNFSKKTKVINRNYLDHGMSYKTVRKKDCIKLFLLLYNLLEFISIIKR